MNLLAMMILIKTVAAKRAHFGPLASKKRPCRMATPKLIRPSSCGIKPHIFKTGQEVHTLDYLPDTPTILPYRECDPMEGQEILHGRAVEVVDAGLSLPHRPAKRFQHGRRVTRIKFGHAVASPFISCQRDNIAAVQPDEEVGPVVHFLVDRQPAEPGLECENVEIGAMRQAARTTLRAPEVEQAGDERMEFFHGFSGRTRWDWLNINRKLCDRRSL
jgi:hypothetical protein